MKRKGAVPTYPSSMTCRSRRHRSLAAPGVPLRLSLFQGFYKPTLCRKTCRGSVLKRRHIITPPWLLRGRVRCLWGRPSSLPPPPSVWGPAVPPLRLRIKCVVIPDEAIKCEAAAGRSDQHL
ncbi:hypothetical protein E2C01_038180 [Portunus trituberculatus]|uniref:Uncharacterized protein n=1 Tax=Portunus trituberculatus TaxID=210409 RepID=A0A5B7FG59_PORTR|nr:hypothetical protein [Portunus trituberculatus]